MEFPASFGGKFSAKPIHFHEDSKIIDRCYRCNRDTTVGNYCYKCSHCNECHSDEPNESHHRFCKADKWSDLIKQSLNNAITSVEDDLLFSDTFLKINLMDTSSCHNFRLNRTKGFFVLHGLLNATDDEDTLAKLLELGANVEAQLVDSYEVWHGNEDRNAQLRAGGRPIHFAARHGRIKCLPALLNAGVDLDATTFGGLKAWELDGVLPEMKIALAAARNTHPKSFAQLAKEELWYAVRYRMRTHQVTDADLAKSFEEKTAAEWIFTHCVNYNYSREDGSYNNDYVPFKVLAEMKYRYGEAGKSQRQIPRMRLLPAPVATAKAVTTEELDVAVTTVLEIIQVIQSDVRCGREGSDQ